MIFFTILFFFAAFICALPLDTLVQLKELSREEFNGRIGIVTKVPTKEGGRYGILVHDPFNDEVLAECFFIKEDNLSMPILPPAVRRSEEELKEEFFRKAEICGSCYIFNLPDLFEHDIEIGQEDLAFIARKVQMLKNISGGNHLEILENSKVKRTARLVGAAIYQRYGIYGCVEACKIDLMYGAVLETVWDGIGVFEK